MLKKGGCPGPGHQGDVDRLSPGWSPRSWAAGRSLWKAHRAGEGVEKMQKAEGLPSHPAEQRAGGVTPGPTMDPEG